MKVLLEMKTESYDVAILGAGFSGLWTSIYLKEKNINHVVISANASNSDSEAKFGIKGLDNTQNFKSQILNHDL